MLETGQSMSAADSEPDSSLSRSAASSRDTFCIYPFLQLNILPDGVAQPCCVYNPVEEDGCVLSVPDNSVEEIWNSKEMRQTRQLMIEGKPVGKCSYCYTHEAKGFTSVRAAALKYWQEGWLNPLNQTIEDVKAKALENNFEVHGGQEWLELNVGNLCNLKCRMCCGVSSSRIANDPVHSPWDWHRRVGVPPLWNDDAVRLVPERVLTVEYEGLSSPDRLQPKDRLVVWMTADLATLRMKSWAAEADSIQVKFVEGESRPEIIEIFANDLSIYRGEFTPLSQSFDLPDSLRSAGEIVLRIQSAQALGIEELKLLRREPRTNDSVPVHRKDGKQWFQNEDFLANELFANFAKLTKLNLIGGETFLVKEVISILKLVISLGVSKNITLGLTTNGTIANEELCLLAEQFKTAAIAVSIDGVADLNEYIRFPSKWSAIEPNIRRFQEINNSYIYVNMTVQAYNMLQVVSVAQYCQQLELPFRYHLLQTPNHLSCSAMPVRARQEAARRIRDYVLASGIGGQPELLLEDRATLLELYEVLLDNNIPPDPVDLNDFMLFTNDLDVSRQQNFASVNQELLGFINASGVPWNPATRFAKVLETE